MTNTVSSVQYYPGYSQQQVSENLQTRTISAITNANPAVVTTVVDHHYFPEMKVTFLVPFRFGMQEINGLVGQVLSVTSNTFIVSIDTSRFNAFAYPVSLPSAYTPPSCIPYSSGSYLPPQPLPYGDQTSFGGVIYNNGAINDPINGR